MENNNENCFLHKHPMIKHIIIGLLIFFGAYCAFYTVADWHFKKMIDPMYQMQKFDREMMRQERKFNEVARKEFKTQQRLEQNTAIRVEKNKNSYRIIIDLRPFDNNEKNVEIKTDDNTVMISATGEKTKGHKQEIVKYSQAFSFGENIDAQNITKVREGNNYIITIPF